MDSKKNDKSNTRLSLKQSINNFSYAWFVFILLSSYCSSYPSITQTKLKGKIHYGIHVITRALPCFNYLREFFYVNNIKVVPQDIYNLLTIQGLAHWIMCDGTFVTGGGMLLQTQSFTVPDCVRLINVLTI